MNQVGDLNKLHDEYFSKGLRVIAISDEPAGTIKSKLIEGKGAKYWVGSDPGKEMLRIFGGGGIPHAYLIDATGTIVKDGHAGSMDFQSLLADTFDPALGRDLHASLKALQKLYEKGEVGKAWVGAEQPAAGADDAARDAQFLRERAVAYAEWRKMLLEKAIEAKDYGAASDDLEQIPKMFAGMEVATWALEKRKALDADAEVAKEMKAFDGLAKARALEAKAEGKAKKLGPARVAYKSVVKKYPGTKAAEMAQKSLDALPPD